MERIRKISVEKGKNEKDEGKERKKDRKKQKLKERS